MFGAGVNNDSGLVGNITLDEQNGDFTVSNGLDVAEPANNERFGANAGLSLTNGRTLVVDLNGNSVTQGTTVRDFQTPGRNFNRTRNGAGQTQFGGTLQSGGALDWYLGDVGYGTDRRSEYLSNKVYPVADLVLPIRDTLQFNGGSTLTQGTNFSAGDINGLVTQNQKQVMVIDNSGKYRSVSLGENGRLDAKRAEALAAEFNASGAILLSALLSQETGYWNPAVTTGADGIATITLTVPERSTAWKFLAKGLSTETLAGEASDDLTVKKDLFGEVKLPLAFTDGDTAEIPVTVHNDAVEKGRIEVVLRTTIGGRRVEETKTIEVTGKGLKEVTFKEELKREVGWDKRAADNAQHAAFGQFGRERRPTRSRQWWAGGRKLPCPTLQRRSDRAR